MKSLLTGKDPDVGKIEGKRRGKQTIIWLDSITDSMDMNLSKLQEIVKDRDCVLQSIGLQRVRHGLAAEQQSPLPAEDIGINLTHLLPCRYL